MGSVPTIIRFLSQFVYCKLAFFIFCDKSWTGHRQARERRLHDGYRIKLYRRNVCDVLPKCRRISAALSREQRKRFRLGRNQYKCMEDRKMRKFDEKGYVRVSKKEARLRFQRGESILLCPVNFRPSSPWSVVSEISGKASSEKNEFDSIVNSFEFYNCCNRETGKYAAFYSKEKEA